MEEIRRGPGRPRKTAREESRPQRRRQRGNAGFARQKLTIQELPGYVCYWSSEANLGMRTQQDDWDHVTYDEIGGRTKVGDISIAQEQQPGEFVTRRTGTTQEGKPEIFYLLKKRREYWEEDEAEKTRQSDEIMNQIKGGGSEALERPDGNVSIKKR